MHRLAAAQAPGAIPGSVAMGTSTFAGRNYGKALTRQLAQIRAAQGIAEASPAATPALPPTPSARNHASGHPVILFTSLLSFLAGAGLMWLALGGADPTLPQGRIAVNTAFRSAWVESTVTAPTAPVTTTGPATPPANPAAPAPGAGPLAVDTAELGARELTERWRSAWSTRDIETYLACYASEFVPADGSTRSAWAAARRKNIESRREISVRLNDLHITRIREDQTKVTFLQDYSSGTYHETAQPKTLILTRVGDDWQITGEWTGDRAAAGVARQ